MFWKRARAPRTPGQGAPPPPTHATPPADPVDLWADRVAPPDLGHHRGKHYTGWVETVKQLKRDGHPDVAADLLMKLLPVVEEEAEFQGWTVAPWYFEQLAIIRRQQHDYAGEVAVLERYRAANASHGGLGPKLTQRLAKAQALLAAQE